MNETNFDMSGLYERINKIKTEGEESSDFTIEFLTCLMERHDLQHALPDDFELDEVPDSIFDSLRSGVIPTKEEIILLSAEIQSYMIFELIWICGICAIGFYSSMSESSEDILDSILAMLDVSPAHAVGCYLIAAFTLLMGKIPTVEMIEMVTNNFDNDPIRLDQSQNLYCELSSAILLRYREDKIYYFMKNEVNDESL